jgi:hypothetical protein
MPISVPGHADRPFRDDGDHDFRDDPDQLIMIVGTVIARECFPQGEVTPAYGFGLPDGVPELVLAQLNTRPMFSPVNASTPPSRVAPHDSGSMWLHSFIE